MSTYAYTAITKDGKQESATIQAASAFAAGHLLKEQGLIPLELKEKREHSWKSFMGTLAGVSLKQKIVFIEDLQIMLKSGVTAPRALRIIGKQTRAKRLQAVIFELSSQVEAGKALHEAMENYPKVFSHIFISMIKVGEMSGNLEKSLE
jgi:general secretion pathway protein F